MKQVVMIKDSAARSYKEEIQKITYSNYTENLMVTKKQALDDLKTKNLSSFNNHQTHTTAQLFKGSGWEKETNTNR